MKNRSTRYGAKRSLVLCVLASALLTVVGCDSYSRVPTSEFSTLDSDTSKEWEIKTKDQTYRARKFAVADSTLVLEDVVWVKDHSGAGYPSNALRTLDSSKLPIKLAFPEVESIDRVEPSDAQNDLGALSGVTMVTVGVVFVTIWYLYAKD